MDARQKDFLAIAGLIALLIASAWSFWPLNKTITQGLDLRGGLSVILTPKGTADNAAMARALTIIQSRVNGLGVSEATVQLENENKAILVQLPGVKDAKTALDALGSTGQLEFVEVASLDATTQAQIVDGFTLPAGSYKAFMTGDVIISASAAVSSDKTQPGYVVNMSFNPTGTTIWGQVTTRAFPTNARIAIVLDHRVVSAPAVINAITDGKTEISGSFTADEAKSLAAILQSGALPVDLQFSQTEVVGPTLGQDALQQGIVAAIIGVLIVAAYFLVYYRAFGVLTWFALGSFAMLYLGVLSALSRAGQFALSLPGLAGIVLSIGLAADTSVLIYERFQEEVGMGKTFRTAAVHGTRHAILTSIDADIVTFASAIPLFVFAIGSVRGFALTLMLGLACDLTVAFLFTIPMVKMLAESVIPKMPAFFGVKGGGSK
jgi:preprotein translocase subunit SecD/SecD/SecF fusion protein